MKIKITFKDPDAVFEAVENAVVASMPEGLSEHEADMLTEFRCKDIKDELKRWIQYGEYVTVEFDLETRKTSVVEVGS